MEQASWIAVKGAGRAAVLSSLGLVETGDASFGGRYAFECADLPGGWTLVLHGADFDFALGWRLQRLSALGEAIGCRACGELATSIASFWRSGDMIWAVTYSGEDGPTELAVEGSPPAALNAVVEASRDADEPHWRHHVALGLSQAICGFGFSEVLPPQTAFRIVEPRRRGLGGLRQKANRTFREAFEARVRRELHPAAEALGFEPLARHPEFPPYYRRGGPHVFVRRREGRSEALEFVWDLRDPRPRLDIQFFVVNDGETPRGRNGQARVHIRGPALPERVLGRRLNEGVFAAAMDEAKGLLGRVDRYLREGVLDPDVLPPAEQDPAPDAD
ncbi:MAG TPA: hypothetical protein VG939_20870 [Caulobacteraceae bacterium]|nr:hypothetical protein [Caulobacteraceae bacterium]